jgi:hypothetical protein
MNRVRGDGGRFHSHSGPDDIVKGEHESYEDNNIL